MKKFCTNCGQENESTNNACIECGASLKDIKKPDQFETARKITKEKKLETTLSRKKDPKSLTVKFASGFAVLLIAALVGVYIWGAKAVSAETVFAQFVEALSEKNGTAMAEVTILSDGKELTDKEANAFIELYRKSTISQLREVVGVEKSGKFLGVIDAYKVVMPSQKASFTFPYDGLSLNLNGKPVKSVQKENDEYVFSGIVPGLYKAEFIYDGELTELVYPFELTAPYQSGSNEVFQIEEDLPIGSVTFEVDLFNDQQIKGNKILLAGKEIPLDSSGKTEEVGPLLLDGSMEVQAELVFPWGTQQSELVPITDEVQYIDTTKLSNEEEVKLVDQATLFVEEYIQAVGTRKSSAFTTVAASNMNEYDQIVESMHSNDKYFTGSLKELGIYDDSFLFNQEEGTVSAEIRVIAEGDYFTQSETPAIDLLDQYWTLVFKYDETKKEWLVTNMTPDHWYEQFTPTKTIAASGKVYKLADASATNTSEDEPDISTQERNTEMEDFFYSYNDASVKAINTGDPSYVYDYLDPDGPRIDQQTDFIKEKFAEGLTEEHISTTLENMVEIADDMWQVTTVEVFIIHGSQKSSEKTYRTTTNVKVSGDQWQIYELVSTPEI